MEGALGPVSFAGGLNILRSQEEYGSGLKGFLSAEIEGLGGMTIVGQFGKKEENDDYYYYGFLASGLNTIPNTPSALINCALLSASSLFSLTEPMIPTANCSPMKISPSR